MKQSNIKGEWKQLSLLLRAGRGVKLSSSQLRVILFPKGHLVMSADILTYSNLGRAIGTQWVEVRYTAKHPTMYKTTSLSRKIYIIQSKPSTVPKLRNPNIHLCIHLIERTELSKVHICNFIHFLHWAQSVDWLFSCSQITCQISLIIF